MKSLILFQIYHLPTLNQLGVWGFINTPIKYAHTKEASSSGVGDIALGLGPRGRINFKDKGDLHWLAFASVILPTGDTKGYPQLGNGRLDTKLGCFNTYLTPSKKFEIDASFDYTIAGNNKNGKKNYDEMSGGLIAGGKITDKVRFGTGFTCSLKDSDSNNATYLVTSRSVVRYTFSKRLHCELIGDIDVINKNMPHGFSSTLLFRYNFGKMQENKVK